MHPRNLFRAGYDFAHLVASSPGLAPFVAPNAYGDLSIDYADPAAVTALNRALLAQAYGVKNWDVPPGYLCPPVPGRSEYLHQLADLLAEDSGASIPRGPSTRVLDIGVGASCIYPLVGASEYGWRFVGADIDRTAVASARRIVAANPVVAELIECRLQPSTSGYFRGVIAEGEQFAASMCNPPFHASAQEAAAGSRRKRLNLGQAKELPLNFGGQARELWCDGGEVGFVQRMIAESATVAGQCHWFTTLVSKRDHVPSLLKTLRAVGAADVRTLAMAQGQKQSRILAWTFLTPDTRRGRHAPNEERQSRDGKPGVPRSSANRPRADFRSALIQRAPRLKRRR